MAKDKPNTTCEECGKPFYAKKPEYTKGCCTKCRIAIHQKVLAQREANDKKATAK